MVEHVSITDPNIHEPKGASTAAFGTVYQANGTGGGTWVPRRDTGWGFYQDDGSAQTVTTSALKLSIDGAGSGTTTTYLPSGISNLWNTTTDKITPGSVGDCYSINLSLPVTGKSGTPTRLILQVDTSGLSSPTTMIATAEVTSVFVTGAVINFALPLHVTTSFVTNGGQIFLTADAGSVEITDPSILITRTHKGS